MTRLYGWAPRGCRLVDKVPHGHWKTSTFLAALRCDRVEAPCLFDGPINGERFARLLFLPKSKLKTLVRKDEPRTFDAVSDALKNALAQVAPSECANYPRHAVMRTPKR
jgi:putative transposase